MKKQNLFFQDFHESYSPFQNSSAGKKARDCPDNKFLCGILKDNKRLGNYRKYLEEAETIVSV